MKRWLFILGMQILGTWIVAQNLAPNPSFETITSCPPGNSGISGGYAPPWNRPPGGITTPDLFHSCGTVGLACNNINVPGNNYGGTSAAFHGVAYAGILTYYTACTNCREYIHAPLTATMAAGVNYEVRMRVKLSPLSRYATNRFGIHLSSTAPNQPSNQPILLTPTWEYPGTLTDKVNWTLLKFNYVATGGEAFITVGNFYNNASTTIIDYGVLGGSCALVTSGNIYYIDSIYVGTTLLDATELPLTVEDLEGKPKLHWRMDAPQQGSVYVVERAQAGMVMQEIARVAPTDFSEAPSLLDSRPLTGRSYYRVRCLLPDGSEIASNTVEFFSEHGFAPGFQLLVYPNPAEEDVSVTLIRTQEGIEDARMQIISADGRTVLEQATGLDAKLDVSGLAPGVYVLRAWVGAMTQSVRLVIQ